MQPSASDLGLCAVCQHARRVASARGSGFLLCELSKVDARFAKYPQLPVVRCIGYQPRHDAHSAVDHRLD